MDRRGVGLAVAGFCTFVNLYPTQALLPTFMDVFGGTRTHTGLTVTASLVAVAAVAPFVGGISDALGRRRLILGAAALLVLPTGLIAAAGSLDAIIALRFVQGLLLPFIFAITVAYISEESDPADAARNTGIYAVGTIVGGFGGRFIAGWVTHFAGWRASFVVLAVLTAGCAAVIGACLPAERRFNAVRGWRSSVSGFRDQFGNPQVMATCAVGFAVLFSIVACFTYANFLLAAPPYGLGPAALGSIFVVYLLGAVSTPIATRLVGRMGRRHTMALGCAIAALGMLLTLAHPLWAIVAGMSLVAAGVFIEQVLSIGYVALAARRARSTAVGLYVTSYYVGGSLGGILPAPVWTHVGWPGCVALVVAVQAAACGITWFAWPRTAAPP